MVDASMGSGIDMKKGQNNDSRNDCDGINARADGDRNSNRQDMADGNWSCDWCCSLRMVLLR